MGACELRILIFDVTLNKKLFGVIVMTRHLTTARLWCLYVFFIFFLIILFAVCQLLTV